MEECLDKLRDLKESEDRVEFKAARHNYPYNGGNRIEPKSRRHCVLGYIVALANEGGGRIYLVWRIRLLMRYVEVILRRER